ncbi:TetR/AcrR family transcriptional regulator [Cryptosporangium aurantiacum]|uniref:Transcriptional regulator, TetR family n=1 Tax=Cryptosporangium aurantiacum TaxID=134849 RepID=A0A1M7PDJ7_9ACTN|nr:TetR/AcrR family transcriptional regulator [Cryptosporangium aurantiacum]SHN15050.1 transcriptional regulator, TetR family [Cryptosporangium aurantiacum]
MADTLREPQQDRSRDKLERIYDASVELLLEGGWGAVTVGDVERRSGVSRGAFYLRFPSREALLDYAHDRLLETVKIHQEQAFERARAAKSPTVDAAVFAAVSAVAEVFQQHGRALMRLDRGEEGGAGEDALNQLSRQFRSVLEPVTGAAPEHQTHLEFAMQLVFSALVLKIQPRVTFSQHTAIDWDSFVRELSEAVTAYLEARLPLAD